MNTNGQLLLPSRRERLAVPARAVKAPFRGEFIERIDLRSLDMYPVPTGSDRGTNTQGDVLTQTIDGRSLNDVWAEFQASLNMHNQFRNRLIGLLTFPVSQPIEDIPVITGDDFEEASEFGVPKGIRGGNYYSMGYDFKWYDLAIRYTWMYLAEVDNSQLQALNNQALEADNRLVFSKIMRALFNNVTRTADIRNTAITVYPLYNADMPFAPPKYKLNTFATTHNHYMTSGAAAVDPGDLDQLATQITEHGYGVGAGGQLILLVNKQEANRIKQFRVTQTDATLKGTNDFIPIASTPAILNANQAVQGAPPATYQGFAVVGQYDRWLVIEEDYIPAGYMLGFATGGEITPTNLVGVRQHANTGLRGLRLVKGRDNDYPLVDSFYNRGFGTGVRHRGAGAIMQVTANATYAIPAEYV